MLRCQPAAGSMPAGLAAAVCAMSMGGYEMGRKGHGFHRSSYDKLHNSECLEVLCELCLSQTFVL